MGQPARQAPPFPPLQALRRGLAHAAIELYAIAFEEAGALDRLEGFASEFGAGFYGLPPSRDTITLVREEWKVPETLRFGAEELVPLRAGETLPWKLST